MLISSVWLLRDDAGDDCRCLLERFMDLSQSGETKVSQMGKLVVQI